MKEMIPQGAVTMESILKALQSAKDERILAKLVVGDDLTNRESAIQDLICIVEHFGKPQVISWVLSMSQIAGRA